MGRFKILPKFLTQVSFLYYTKRLSKVYINIIIIIIIIFIIVIIIIRRTWGRRR